jgi:hypothetical protein
MPVSAASALFTADYLDYYLPRLVYRDIDYIPVSKVTEFGWKL